MRHKPFGFSLVAETSNCVVKLRQSQTKGWALFTFLFVLGVGWAEAKRWVMFTSLFAPLFL